MTSTNLSFSKNTWFVDAPPTGADGGKFVKFAPLIAGSAPLKLDDGTVPLKLVAVKTPVTIAPVFVVTNLVLLLKKYNDNIILFE